MPTKVEEIRILHFGKFLDDTKTLKGKKKLKLQIYLFISIYSHTPRIRITDYNFATGTDNQTTVHISVRIMGAVSEDVKEKMNKKSGACCVIM